MRSILHSFEARVPCMYAKLTHAKFMRHTCEKFTHLTFHVSCTHVKFNKKILNENRGIKLAYMSNVCNKSFARVLFELLVTTTAIKAKKKDNIPSL